MMYGFLSKIPLNVTSVRSHAPLRVVGLPIYMSALLLFLVIVGAFAAIPVLIVFFSIKATESEQGYQPQAVINSVDAHLPTSLDREQLSDSFAPYKPNEVPKKKRIINTALSILFLIYGTYGVITDHLILPAKGGKTLTLYGYPAWIMYLALLCLVANLLAVVIDHYDRRDNEALYRSLSTQTRRLGWMLFTVALVARPIN